MSKVGAFDAYVQDAQEAKMRRRYQEYLQDGDTRTKPYVTGEPKTFEEFCEQQEESSGRHD